MIECLLMVRWIFGRSLMVDPYPQVMYITKAVVFDILSVGWYIKKDSLLLIEKNSPCNGSNRWFFLSEWSFPICLTSYNHK